jgi:hypothetical protein
MNATCVESSAADASLWTIRSATHDDLDRLVALSLLLARKTEDRYLDKSAVRSGIRSLIESPAQGFVLVAEDEKGDVVGELMVGGAEWSEWSNGRFWCITSCAFDPRCDGDEIVRALHRRLVELARMAWPRVIGIKGCIRKGNTWATNFFPRLGFKPNHYSVFEHSIDHRGVKVDEQL